MNIRFISWTAAGLLCLSALTGAAVSLHWPLMGDSTYMHYAVRLMHHGMRPYADIYEMNMPGSYLLEEAAIRIFGAGDLGWRLYDLILSICSIFLMMRMTGRHVAGFCAGAMLLVVHLQDGVMMGGERDYAMTTLLLAAVFYALRSSAATDFEQRLPTTEKPVSALLSGMGLGAAICIKPTAFIFVFVLLWWIGLRAWRNILALVTGLTLPMLACWIWLAHWHAVHAFMAALNGLVRYHASLDNKPFSFLFTHAISPIGVLVAIWFVGALLYRRASRLQWMLRFSALCGWLTYALQRKGFSYQRYPFLAFLLLVIAYDLALWFSEKKRTQWIAVTGTGFAVGLAIFLTIRTTTYSHLHPETAISTDIQNFNSSGQPQCMDTAGYCIAALDRLQKLQPTGLIYDCYLTQESSAVSQALRNEFLERINVKPPQTIILTDSVCYGEPRTFDKYHNWPQFDSYLAEHYMLAVERHPTPLGRYWSRTDVPFAWRVYVRR